MKLATILGLLVIGFIGLCSGYTFHVGGKDGWVHDPRESYNHWAERNRFQVNDTLVFKYTKGLDSVLLVNEEAYNKCNTTNSIQTLNDENPIFKFTRSGPFFFISGHNDKCENGEKLIVVVMAVRHHKIVNSSTTAPPTPAPAPALAPELAPSATLQTADGKIVQAPAPAPANSGVAYIGSGGFVGLILGLSLILV
ncbi:early nodulin-like protein 3 [Bidens hawaiensis]|uniref:early nodulin-like protein 3 n=1 Tax=Bidens hawaiensis TaxID=980011 RepID=UPI00404AE092